MMVAVVVVVGGVVVSTFDNIFSIRYAGHIAHLIFFSLTNLQCLRTFCATSDILSIILNFYPGNQT